MPRKQEKWLLPSSVRYRGDHRPLGGNKGEKEQNRTGAKMPGGAVRRWPEGMEGRMTEKVASWFLYKISRP